MKDGAIVIIHLLRQIELLHLSEVSLLDGEFIGRYVFDKWLYVEKFIFLYRTKPDAEGCIHKKLIVDHSCPTKVGVKYPITFYSKGLQTKNQ